MSNNESGRKRRERKSAGRLQQEAEDRRADVKADDANVQRMIERSIKDHGA